MLSSVADTSPLPGRSKRCAFSGYDICQWDICQREDQFRRSYLPMPEYASTLLGAFLAVTTSMVDYHLKTPWTSVMT
jgi:hypothetical protein